MHVDRRTRSLHYFNAFAVKDRVDSSSLSPRKPSPRLQLDVTHILPSDHDLYQLVQNCSILLSRVLVEYIPMFSALGDVVCTHIKHAESKAMAQKSVVVSYCIIHIPCMHTQTCICIHIVRKFCILLSFYRFLLEFN